MPGQPPWPGRTPAPQALERVRAPAPPAPESSVDEPAAACRFWRPHPSGQCTPRLVPQGSTTRPAPDEGATPEPPREDRPQAILHALAGGTPGADPAPQPPHIDVHASQGTATQLAKLMEDDANGFSLPDISQPVDASDENPELPAASPPGDRSEHKSCLAALIASSAVEEVNPCRLFDTEHLSAVGRRMRAAGQEATPLPGPHSPESGGLSPIWAKYAKRIRELLQLVDLTLGVPSFPLSSWEGVVILASNPPGLGMAVCYVIKGKLELRLPTPDGGTRPVGGSLAARAHQIGSPPQAAIGAYGAPARDGGPCRCGPNSWGDGESFPGGCRCLWSACGGRLPPSVRAHQLGGRGDLPRRRSVPMERLRGPVAVKRRGPTR